MFDGNSDAMNLEARFRAGRPCLEGSKSRNRLSKPHARPVFCARCGRIHSLSARCLCALSFSAHCWSRSPPEVLRASDCPRLSFHQPARTFCPAAPFLHGSCRNRASARPCSRRPGSGLLGWGVGAVAGHAIQGDCFDEYCGLEGIFYGGAAGGGMGLAVGAHLGNRRRGSFPLDVLTSGAVWGVGYALMSSFANDGDGAGVVLTAIMLPPTQLVATVLVERATGRSRAGRLQAP